MIYIIKKSKFLIITFVTISFFSLLMVYLLQKSINLDVNSDVLLSSDSITFKVGNSNNEENDYINLLNLDGKYTLIKNEIVSNYKAIFFNEELRKEPEIIKGRFFNKNDFLKDKKYIVLGKKLTNNIITKDGKDYYYLENDYYEVIGIMGDKKEEKAYDCYAYINLDSLLIEKDNEFIQGELSIDSKTKTREVYENLKQKYDKAGYIVKEQNENKSLIARMLELSATNTFSYMLEIVGILVINIILITEYWIKKRKIEIGVKRTVGSTKFRISINIIKELILISLFSYLVGYCLFLIVSYLIDGYFHFYLLTTVIVLIISIVIALIGSLVPIIIANKMEASEVIK